MTIKQYAENIGISQQAVYQRLKEQGVSISNLKDRDGKNLSPEGIKTLDSFFEKRIENTLDGKDKETGARLNHLEAENAILRAENEKLKAILEAKEETASILKSQLEYMQKLNAATLQRIPDHKPAFLQRLIGRTKKEEENSVK